MYILKDRGIISEITCGNNFGYVLEKNTYFLSTDYKVLLSQTNGIFVRCMKMMCNGKIELFYITDDYRSMSAMFGEIVPDVLVTIAVNMFGSVIEVQNNGFLSSQNIDISWNKIFVDPRTLKVKLVYIPVSEKVFENYAEFESELRTSLIKLIDKNMIYSNDRMEKFMLDLANGSMTIEDIYNKFKGAGMAPMTIHSDRNYGKEQQENTRHKMVAMNAPEYFEIILEQDDLVIGRKQELVDVAVPFSKAISRTHCRIINNNGNYVIVDVASANGTFINKDRIEPYQETPVHRGDIIRLGDIDFQFV